MTPMQPALVLNRAIAGLLSVLLSSCGGGSGSEQSASHSDTDNSTSLPATAVLLTTSNSNGVLATYTEAGFIDEANPFFRAMGNGRSCATCHQASDAWSLTPATVRQRFDESHGTDALFRVHDGANSPLADVSTVEAREAAYSMLLTKAVIRMSLPVPDHAEFELAAVDDPYGYASSNALSLFRRPLPAANLRFLSTVMWDGRQTHKDENSSLCIAGTNDCYRSLDFNLALQASSAVQDHAQAQQEFTSSEQAAIVDFEKKLFTAQLADKDAGSLTGMGAKGGPLALADTPFYFGINDRDAGDYRTQAPFTPRAMTLFDAWKREGSLADPDTPISEAAAETQARQAIVRGQAIFNNRDIFINNVSGMPTASIRGTCSSCHSAPNTGSHSIPLLVDIGVAAGSRRTADMPLYTLRNKATGETVQTMDPGAALLTGKWEDIGRVKVPVLRGLAARAPYFHNGSAKDLTEVIDFYNTRFEMRLSPQEVTDLTAFLRAL